MKTSPPHILVTGATGLLGRPVMHACSDIPGARVIGASFRRTGPSLECMDLSQPGPLPAWLDRLAPNIIIHAAAERRPDVSEKDPAGTQRLNVGATASIAQWAATRHAFLIYISTDYVFDGKHPPYKPSDATHPLNAYGLSKLDGERAVQAAACDAVILRVPILYGHVETLDESPVTVLAKNMLNARAGEQLAMEHWATRYPTHTRDVAAVLQQIVLHKQTHPDFAGIFHWSGNEPMTKYDMACACAPFVTFDPTLLVPDATPPAGAPRPKNAHLDSSDLERLGIGQRTPFRTALPAIFSHYKSTGA